ncbi:MAG: SH3 domain-containing protein [Candidatus Buchananbacteria bacterium]
MKKIVYSFLLIVLALTILPGQIKAATAKKAAPKVWSAAAPKGFLPITWAKARGIASFFKPQESNGYIDYLTIIYLPYNQLRLIASTTPQTTWGEVKAPFTAENASNWVFTKMATEKTKNQNPDAQFIWNMPFFNITSTTTDLSLALKSTWPANKYITSGSRPDFDMSQSRRMLIIDNQKMTAKIADFNETTFLASGDVAVEGFAPSVIINGYGDSSARLFVGVRAEGKELVIYCSRGAYLSDASNALLAAGVSPENQMQADGGASATCAYNLPGQYFVEPGRMLPHLMAAFPFLYRGTIINDGVNLRNGPGAKYKSLARLAKGTNVIVYEEKTGFVRIDQSQQWVSKSLVKKVN